MTMTKLQVKVERILYPPATQEGDFFVLLTDKGKGSGKMKWRPEIGERLTLSGEWGAYRGEKNFNFKAAMPDVPINPRDQLHYVCERTVGIGPAMEQMIWDAMGEKWPEITAGAVRGLTPTRYQALMESFNLMSVEGDKTQAVTWLMGKGATMNMALAAFERFGSDTIGVIQDNCFRLADLKGYSFSDVDERVRREFGVGDTDPRRIRAALLYRLRQLTSSGSTVIEWHNLQAAVAELVGGHNRELITSECREMFADGTLKGFPGSMVVSLKEDYVNEADILEYVGRVA